jgi:hypothetical protein
MRVQSPNAARANRRWRGQFRYRGSSHESAVAQLSTLGKNETDEESVFGIFRPGADGSRRGCRG